MRAGLLFIITLLTISCATLYNPSLELESSIHRQAEIGAISPEHVKDISGESHLKYFKPLLKYANSKGVIVKVMNEDFLNQMALGGPETLWGYYDDSTKTIWLNPELSSNAAVATLAHELGHFFQPRELDTNEDGQAFAEAVSWIVCHRIHLNIDESSMSYMLRYDYQDILTKYNREINLVSNEMLEAIQ